MILDMARANEVTKENINRLVKEQIELAAGNDMEHAVYLLFCADFTTYMMKWIMKLEKLPHLPGGKKDGGHGLVINNLAKLMCQGMEDTYVQLLQEGVIVE